MRLQGFDPVLPKHPRILILGSMPSAVSLDKQEYYGYSQNRFWKILSAYFDETFADYEAKKQCLYQHDIALWDVIGSCERIGSLDSAIKDAEVNDIEGLLKQFPSITNILCNGKKSSTLFMRHFKHIPIQVHVLPSTSNANRTIHETDVYNMWFEILDQVFA